VPRLRIVFVELDLGFRFLPGVFFLPVLSVFPTFLFEIVE
jgi:hypothetical protein